MNYKKIVLAGGSGYIGTVLAEHYSKQALDVVIIGRRFQKPRGNIRTVIWDGKTVGAWADELAGADALFNLCGKNVNCRYNERNKREIFSSRLDTVKLLGEAICIQTAPPRLWITLTSATIYRHAEDRPQDEFNGEFAHGFSGEVCKQWEKTFFAQQVPVRKVALRTAIVLGKSGGALPYYLKLATLGLGGRHGNGKQYISWIHEQDICGITDYLIVKPNLDGIFNASSPDPLPNSAFMKTIRDLKNVPFGLPAEEWMLKMGALLLGTETELMLKSRWVLPTRLLNEGYTFRFQELKEAISNILMGENNI